jgi:4-hydroxy-4-methyl-2-oxoglutarate aldolase
MLVRERNALPDASILDRVREVEPATMGHIVENSVMEHRIQGVYRPIRAVGFAFTVRVHGDDSAILHYALDLAGPNDVLVIDRGGEREHACLGGMVAFAAHHRGIAGAVIDGPCTDIAEISELQFPVFSDGLSALTTRLGGRAGEINVPVDCGGITVFPGDIVTADDNGVVVLRPDEAAAVAEESKHREARETDLKKHVLSGGSLAEFTGAKAMVERSKV